MQRLRNPLEKAVKHSISHGFLLASETHAAEMPPRRPRLIDPLLSPVKPMATRLARPSFRVLSANHHRVRLRNALQACSKVRCLANDCLLLRSARPDQITDDHQAGRNADARLQGRVGTVTWRRSARSSGETLGALGGGATSAEGALPKYPAMTDRTNADFLQVLLGKFGRTRSLILLSRNTAWYTSRPRLRSQTTMSIMAA